LHGGFAKVLLTKGARFLHRFSDRPLARLALIGLVAAALGLAACGRKGQLDPPPGASLQGVAQRNAPNLISNNRGAIARKPAKGNPAVGDDGQVQAPQDPGKTIPLDNLLN
jgi:predicted small lipoprotein YifL